MALVEDIYKITKGFPKEEIYGLTNQMRRSAVSIPSNIAEGAARITDKEFINFLGFARGSLSELETQLTLAERLGFSEKIVDAKIRIDKVFALLNGLIGSLRNRNS